MELTLKTPGIPADSVIDALRAQGVSDADIRMALDFQEAQRRAGAPVFPLRVICGLEAPTRRNDRMPHTPASVATPARRRGKGGLHITRNPVWAQSVQTGSDEEGAFASRLTAKMRARLVIAGKRAMKLGRELARQARGGDRTLSEQEQKLVSYTPSCQQILTELLDNEKFRKGWCIPAYETIMRWTGLSRSTVYRSLRILADIGLIEWIRRFVYESDSEVGARSTQTSNLYRFGLPVWLEKLVGLFVPISDDDVARRASAAQEYASMLASRSSGTRSRPILARAKVQAGIAAVDRQIEERCSAACEGQECHDGLPPPPKNLVFKREES